MLHSRDCAVCIPHDGQGMVPGEQRHMAGVVIYGQFGEKGKKIRGVARGGIMPEVCMQIFFPGGFHAEIFINILVVHWVPFLFRFSILLLYQTAVIKRKMENTQCQPKHILG